MVTIKLMPMLPAPKQYITSPLNREFSVALQHNRGLGHLIFKFLDHTQIATHTHTQSVAIPCTRDQSVTQAATYRTHSKHNTPITMPSEEIEPATPVIKRPHNYDSQRKVIQDRRL
jgi:hypothetical protein